ncbi:unnamed protein product [Heligmosomoides polygyrus]|uniref:39S ribosomal protein L35, mitochondrial n=1 Tax=Heligmosomoides polygyrus TaxID=6339 RepID=A0A183GL65_HELPZ|nr:unnamed protein product [Heligmosomoides polygyrus]
MLKHDGEKDSVNVANMHSIWRRMRQPIRSHRMAANYILSGESSKFTIYSADNASWYEWGPSAERRDSEDVPQTSKLRHVLKTSNLRRDSEHVLKTSNLRKDSE